MNIGRQKIIAIVTGFISIAICIAYYFQNNYFWMSFSYIKILIQGIQKELIIFEDL